VTLVCAALAFFAAAFTPWISRAISGYRAAKSQPATASIVRARANWFFRQRALANGHIPNGLLLRALEHNQIAIAAHKTFFDGIAAKPAQISPQLNTWTALGPQPTANNIYYGNVSGRVSSIAADPCDATGNTVYVGAADGGVWASFNALSGNSVTWTPLTDSQPSLAVGAIALVSAPCASFNGRAQSKEIIVGTGESNFARDNLYGAGVLRSLDGGQTWAQDQTFTAAASQGPDASGPYIAAIAVQPNAVHPVLLAAVQGTDYAAGGSLHSGVWRSLDSGTTWTRTQPGAASGNSAPFNPATDVLFDPSDATGKTAYAALGAPRGDSDPNVSCSTEPCNGLYVTSDAGATWHRVTALDSATNPSSYGRISLALSAGATPSSSVVWASIADATTGSDNLLSVLYGTGIASNSSSGIFTAVYPNNSPLPDFCAPLCFYSMKLAAMPQSAGGAVFAGGSAQPQLAPNAFGTSSVYRSLDGGNSWSDMSADGSGNGTSAHTHVHTFSFANAANGSAVALYVGNDGGVWASTDVFKSATASGSQHWADLNTNSGNANTSLNITQFYPGMSVHPSSDQILYGGTQGNDAEQYIGSLPWADTLACPWDGGFTAIDPETPTTIYVACNYLNGPGTITKNTQDGIPGDDGVNWGAIDFNNGINFSDNADFIPPFVLDSNASSNLYFGTYRLFQSTNQGMTWSPISSDLTTDGSSEYVTAISVAPSNSNVIYAGTSDGLLWQSAKALSGATDIHKVNRSGQPAREVSVIAVDSTNSTSVFAAYSGFSCPGVTGCDGLGHIFYSSNSGSSWLEVDGNLPDVPVNDLVIDPTDSTDNTIYIATDAGVYASANATAGAGTTWSVLQAGLPNAQVLSLKLRRVSRTLVAGTHGRGAWNIQLPGLPAFVLTGLDPVSTNTGSGDTQITATGNGFTQQSVVNLAGNNALTTTYVNATTLTADVPAATTLCGGTLSLNVIDPTAGSTNALPLGVVGSCDFSLSIPTPGSATTSAGGSASYQFTVQLQGNSAAPVQLTCPNAPAGITCAFSPNPVTPTTTGASVRLTVSAPSTITTTSIAPGGDSTILNASAPANRRNLVSVTLILAALAWTLVVIARRDLASVRFPRAGWALALLIVAISVMTACGGGGGGPPPPTSHTYTIPITGSAGNLTHSTSVQLVVD
jgi:IPT/TIG domain